jgi:hypothetical protein
MNWQSAAALYETPMALRFLALCHAMAYRAAVIMHATAGYSMAIELGAGALDRIVMTTQPFGKR